MLIDLMTTEEHAKSPAESIEARFEVSGSTDEKRDV
jgi:hypothetical protein